jgi:hypothetical protein
MPQHFINHYEVEQKAGGPPAEFLKFLEDSYAKEGLITAVGKIKLSGICLSLYPSNPSKCLYLKSVKLLTDLNGNKEESIKLLEGEVEILEKAVKDFYDWMEISGVNKVPKEKQAAAFLLVAESMISAFIEQSEGLNPDGKVVQATKGMERTAQVYESMVRQIAEVLLYFKFKHIPFVKEGDVVKKAVLSLSARHLTLYDRFSVLKQTYEKWMFQKCNCKIVNHNEIWIEQKDKEKALDADVSFDRSEMAKFQRGMELMNFADESKFIPETKKFFPKYCRDILEFISGAACVDFFDSFYLKEKIGGVKIVEWLRAYTVLRKIGSTTLKARTTNPPAILEKWCILKSENGWINEFIKGGIKQKSAKIIFENLIFERGESIDLCDCPFIPFNGRFLVLPSVIRSIHPAEAILSNANKKEEDVSFKGDGFEKQVLEELNKAGICSVGLYSSEKGEQFQCDAAFELDGDLYFLECKSIGQPKSIREYHGLLLKLQTTSGQLTRIASHFSKEITKVNKKLNKSTSWKPKGIFKIIVTKAMLGKALCIDDCLVVDESAFVKFLVREQPAVVMGTKKQKIKLADYEGQITSEKLIKYIKDPAPIRLLRKQYEEREIVFKNNKFIFKIHSVEKKATIGVVDVRCEDVEKRFQKEKQRLES